MPVWALVLSIAIAAVSQQERVETMAYPIGLLSAMWDHHRSQQYDDRTRKPLITLGDFS
jgi:hypothetical protein